MARLTCLASLLSLVLVACVASGQGPEQKREHVDQRTKEVLDRLFAESPAAEEQIERAAGYAVFSNIGVDLLFVGGGGGYGVAIDNDGGERTYMRMGEAGVGIGLGVKDFRVVFVFQDHARFDSFVRDGWDVSADANAAAEVGGEGASASGAASFQNGVALYQLTETGLALRANVKGTKYWPYEQLN